MVGTQFNVGRRLKVLEVDLIAIAVLAVAGFLSVAYGVMPGISQTRVMAEEERRLSADLAKSAEVKMGLDSIEGEISRIQARLTEFDSVLPARPQIDLFIGQLTSVAEASAFRIDLIQPGALDRRPMYSQVSVSLDGHGSFEAVHRFLTGVRGLARLTRVERMQIAASRDDAQCRARMTLLIYVSGA